MSLIGPINILKINILSKLLDLFKNIPLVPPKHFFLRLINYKLTINYLLISYGTTDALNSEAGFKVWADKGIKTVMNLYSSSKRMSFEEVVHTFISVENR